MSIFTPEGSKPRYTREEDKLLLQLVKKGERVWNISSRLMRSEASVKGRLRFLKYLDNRYGKNMAKALEKYHLRNKKELYVSSSKWTEEADRDLIKKCNGRKVYKFDKRASRRMSLIRHAELKLCGTDGVQYNNRLAYIDSVMNYLHKKTVPASVYFVVLGKYRELIKQVSELKSHQKYALSILSAA